MNNQKTATIILNRNLPIQTDQLVQKILKKEKNLTDVFVIEAGSDENKLSKYCTWYVKSKEVIKNGLRYSRGMNYGLLQLYKEGYWDKYNSFFLLTNDTTFPENQATIKILQKILIEYPRVGLISPCSQRWGEKNIIGKNSLKYFWFIHNNAYFFRKEMLDELINFNNLNYINFLFDGNNFRGYLSESEIIAKAYANDWAAAITTKAMAEEEESYLFKQSTVIKTDSFEKNLHLYIEEGLNWIKKKYGFNSRWQMIQYSKIFYENFFKYFPSEESNKI